MNSIKFVPLNENTDFEPHTEVIKNMQKANLKFNKDIYLFRCTRTDFFREITLHYSVSPGPRNVEALMNMPLPKSKKELWLFVSNLSYLSKFSTMMAKICDLLKKLTSVKAEWL